jgi:hypothetical protein
MEVKHQKENEFNSKEFNLSLHAETWRPNNKLKLKKGISFLDAISGECDNVEDYVQKGDEIHIPKGIFGKAYVFKVVNVQSNNNGEPFCTMTSNSYISKNVVTFLNNLKVKRFSYDTNTVTTEGKNSTK